jgi:hypothetical protein
MKAKILGLAAAGLMLASTASVSATLYGSTVDISFEDSIGTLSLPNVTVGDGAEVSCDATGGDLCQVLLPGESIDIGTNSITFTFLGDFDSSDPFFGFRFTGLQFFNPASGIGSATDSSANLTGFRPNFLTWTADSVSVDLGGVNFINPDETTGTLTIALAPPPEPIPEPSTYVLLGVGLLGLLALRRRAAPAA